MFKFDLTAVVRILIIVNILFFAVSFLLMNANDSWRLLAMYYPGLPPREVITLFGEKYAVKFYPFQLLTHMFMHAGPLHILFNMLTLAFLGPEIEYRWGPKRFLFFYILCGLGSIALHIFSIWVDINYFGAYRSLEPTFGASGAIAGVFVAFGFIYPNQIVSLFFPPISMKAKNMIVAFLSFSLLAGLGLFGDFLSGIAHFAHIGGALTGLLLLLYWKTKGINL